MDGLNGKQFGKYYVQGSCGAGGMGTVFRARDMDLNRVVALKVIHPHLVRQQNFYERFIEEARLIAHLEHPNIVKIYDFSTTRDPLYFVMPYYMGNLKLFLGRQPERRVPEQQALALTIQVAHALHYAHAEKVIHGDIKPENILIQTAQHLPPDREPVQAILADFGLATLLEADSEATPAFIGSWAYMAPERIEGETADARSDLYALGITLYQLLVGRPPFEIKTLQDALQMHTHALPPLDHETITPEIKEVLQKALAKRPEDRFQTGLEFAEALQDLDPFFEAPTAFTQGSGLETLIAFAPDEEVPEDEVITEMLTMGADTTAQAIGGGDLRDGDFIVVNQIASQLYSIQDKDVVRIGRAESNDIVLDHKGVTAAHATLRRTADGWEVRDLNSTNGVYLDNDRLLPDQEEAWKAHQQLRIGPYNLELRTPNGSDGAVSRSEVVAWLEPSSILDDLQPGGEYIGRIQLRNNGTIRDYVQISVTGLDEEWYRLPQNGLPLAPNEEPHVLIYFTPPLNQAAGTYSYQVRIESLMLKKEPTIIKGRLNIEPLTDFRVMIHPTQIIDQGSCTVTIHNYGNVDSVYRVKSEASDAVRAQRVRFGVLPENVYTPQPQSAPADESAASPSSTISQAATSPAAGVLRRYVPFLFNNPLVKGYRQGRIYQRRAGQVRRDFGRLSGAWPRRSQLRKAQFANALLQQVEIPAGESREVEFLLKSGRRRRQGGDHVQKIPLIVEDDLSDQQQEFEIELTTTARQTPLWLKIVALVVGLILLGFLCFGVIFALREINDSYNFGFFPTVTAAPDDPDGDGLPTTEELRLGLNPQNADTDNDGINDGEELNLGRDPRVFTVLSTPTPDLSVAITRTVEAPAPTLLPTPELISWEFDSGGREFLIVGDNADNQVVQASFTLDIPFDSVARIQSAAIILTEATERRIGDIDSSLGNIYLQPYVDNRPFGAAIVLRPLSGEQNVQRWQANLNSGLLTVMEENRRLEFVLFAENPSDLDNARDQLFLYTRAANNRAEWPVLLINSQNE